MMTLKRTNSRGIKGVLGLLGGAAAVLFVYGNWPDKAHSIAPEPAQAQVAKQPSPEDLAKVKALMAEDQRIRQEDEARAAEAARLAEQQAEAAAVIAQQQLEEEPTALAQIKALQEAMHNLQTCDEIFGPDADSPDPDACKIAIGAAAKLFLRRIGDLTQPISDATREKAAAILMGEDTALLNGANDGSLQIIEPAPVCDTFVCCVSRFLTDLTLCGVTFPDDPNALAICKAAAGRKFNRCADSLQQAPVP